MKLQYNFFQYKLLEFSFGQIYLHCITNLCKNNLYYIIYNNNYYYFDIYAI